MSSAVEFHSAAPVRTHAVTPNRFGLFTFLEHPGQAFSNITPNWYAAVMGTGIVANAAASLPTQFRGLREFGVVVWALAAFLLVALLAATAVHWVNYRDRAANHHNDPIIGHFYGAPPMAFLTVGAGTLLLGRDVIGLRAAVDVDWVLWGVGTITGLTVAGLLPYLTFTRHDVQPDSAFGGWLMPVVPPMVSAALGGLLVPYARAGQLRLTLLMGCYAMFGLALLASIVVITLIWLRLAQHKVGPAKLVPTLWIVLGPLGQSITAVNLLGAAAHEALPAPYSTGFQVLGLVYGVPVWGFAMLWGALALAITIRTAREKLPFSLTWWSFTFPVGTVVTGTSGLALHSHADLFCWAAPVIYAGLVAAWALVFVRTVRGAQTGELLAPPSTLPQLPATA